MVDGFGLAGLPDVSDDDWNAYTADQFSASIDPFRESLRFQQMTANAFDPILNAAAAAEPPPTMGAPVGQGLRSTAPVPDSGYGGYTQPDFGSLRSMMDAPDSHQVQIGPTGGPTAGPGLNQPGGPIGPGGPPQAGFWEGTDPSKPNVFSYLGEQAQQGVNALRSSGMSQTPVVGPIAAGAGQFAANALGNLGGTAQALRQGNLGGAAGGLLQATVGENTPLGIGKDIATEAQWPTQIVPGISPETPVIGGLNNPRELAGLIPQMALPETALERAVGHGIREAAGPVLRGAGELAGRAADRLGISAAPEGALAEAAYAGGVGPPGRGLTEAMTRQQVPADEQLPMGVFFSKLGQSIDALPQERMTLGQAKSALAKMGVKPDELRWTGIEDLLNGNDNYFTVAEQMKRKPGTITKSELREQFAQGNVEVREVINAQPRGTPEWEAANERYLDLERQHRQAMDEYVQRFTVLNNPDDPQLRQMSDYLQGLNQEKIAAGNMLSSLPMPEQVPGSDPPRYENYMQKAMPGQGLHDRPGTREVLLTINTPGRPMAGGYTSGHWKPQNIVVHARLTDRSLPDGRRALHVEEVQSDWHQAGRESGYQPSPAEVQGVLPDARGHVKVLGVVEDAFRDYRAQHYAEAQGIKDWMRNTSDLISHPDTTARAERLREIVRGERELRNEVENAKAQVRAFQDQGDVQRAAADMAELEHREVSLDRIQQQVDRTDPDDPMARFWQNEYQAERIEHGMAQNRIRSAEGSLGVLPPRAPFEKTQAWTALAMKRLLRMASEEGYDVLSWTPAHVQGERYSGIFRGVADQIEYSPEESILYLREPGGNVQHFENVTAEALPQWIGPDRAQRLLDSPRTPSYLEEQVWGGPVGNVRENDRSLVYAMDEQGLNVQQPVSQGMSLQYDKVMPQVMADIGKPWGARSGMGEIELWPGGDRSPAHMVEITPEMRQSINERGFPLFATSQGGSRGGAMSALESPFFSPARTGGQAAADIALGAAGGATGAATGPEDQTWQERAKRGVAGAALGAMAGPLARAPRGGLALARRAMEGRGDELPLRAAAGGEDIPPGVPPVVPPHLAPDTDPLPPVERAGDVLGRVLAEMTPEGRSQAQEMGALGEHRAPWLGQAVASTAGEAPTGGNRYTDIMAVADPEKTLDATGSPGDAAGDAMDAATTPGAETPYAPPHKFDKAELARLGNTRILQNLPDAQREMAEQGVADMTEQLQRDHGFRSEASAKEAAQRIMPHILQFARNAKPNEPVNEVLLRAARDAWAQSIFPSYFAQIEHWKMRNDPAASDADKGAYAQAESYWDAVRQVLGRYAGEIAPSEAARTFRSMRDLPEPVVASVAGGSGVAGPINRAAKTPREKAYEDMMAAMRKSRRGETAAETAGETASRRGTARVSGKRPSGPLANLGLEWADVLRRTGNDDADRMNILAGLEELGGYRMRRDWVDRAMKLDLSDGKSVDAFWNAARKSAGVDEQMRPFVKFDPNVSGQSYLGGADALTKNQALSMVSKELIRDADQAQSAARAARDAGKPSKSLDEAAAAAFGRLGLKIENWNPDNLPILSRAAESVRERIAREWPADRKAGSGAAEQVEKKRQLLGIFDQEIKKGQRLAGVPVTGIQDLLSFGTSNVLTTARFVQASVLESALSAVNEPLQSFLRGRYGEGVQQLRGLGRAFGFTPSGDDLLALGEGVRAPAMANALRGLKDIGPMEAAGELRQVAEKGAGMIRSDTPNAFAKMLSPMHRVSRGISEAFQTGNYFAEVNRLAHEASTTGRLPGGRRIEQIVDDATGETRNPTVKEMFGNLPQDIVDEALKRSRLTNAGGEVGRIEGWVGQAKGMLNKPNATSMERTTGLFANLMFPFVYGLRPAIRAGEAGITGPVKYPINVVQALARGDTEEAKYAGKKAALAIGFDGFIAYNVLGGNITGHGPSSPEARQALMEQTDERGDPIWRPDSYRIATPGGGHAWVKYSSLPGPVSTVATVMANLYEAYVYDGKDMETAPEQAQRMAMSVLPSYLDNTYFRDMINLVEAMGANGGAPQVGRVAEQVLGRFVPGAGALRTAATVTDPYARLAESPGQGIASGIPGLRQRLPARVSAYTGGPVEESMSAASLAGGLAGNVYGSPSRPNPLARESATLSARDPFTGVRPSEGVPGGVFPNSFGRGEQSRGTDFAGQRQTPEAIRGAQAAFGQQSQADLLPLINSAEYAAMDPHAKAQRLAQEVRRSTAGSEYAAEGAPGIALDPNRQVQREMLQVPRYYGVSGSPDQIAEQNQQIAAARNSLSQLITRYGRGRAMGMLSEQNPEAFRLAMIHKPMNRDALWFQEQQFSQQAGVGLDTAGVYVPDYGSGSDVITGNGAFDRRALPPGLRS